MTTDDLGLADDIERYSKRYRGDWAKASPTMSWAELDMIISALRSPRAVPANGAGREAIARIIAPDWFNHGKAISNYPGQDLKFQEIALAKADAILALASSPVVGPSTQPRPHGKTGDARS